MEEEYRIRKAVDELLAEGVVRPTSKQVKARIKGGAFMVVAHVVKRHLDELSVKKGR